MSTEKNKNYAEGFIRGFFSISPFAHQHGEFKPAARELTERETSQEFLSGLHDSRHGVAPKLPNTDKKDGE